MMHGVVRVQAVRKSYRRGSTVLDGVSFDVEPGRPVVIRGDNGCGKSTLLRIVAGCAAPTAGRVTGRPGTVGYVPDRFPAQLRLSARGYLRHLAAIHGVPAARSLELLAELGFTGGRHTPMARLSKGNAQKVALAQALGCEPALLVLDEPWSGLDTDAASTLDALLADVGAALLVATHGARGPSGAHTWWLRAGRLVAQEPAVVAMMAVELWCAGDPRPVLDRLPQVDDAVLGPERISLVVPADRSDAVLAAALRAGCRVRGVREVSR